MANIGKEVDIDLLEKQEDGTFIKKNPTTTAAQVISKDGVNLEEHTTDREIHLTSLERARWNAKQNARSISDSTSLSSSSTAASSKAVKSAYDVATAAMEQGITAETAGRYNGVDLGEHVVSEAVTEIEIIFPNSSRYRRYEISMYLKQVPTSITWGSTVTYPAVKVVPTFSGAGGSIYIGAAADTPGHIIIENEGYKKTIDTYIASNADNFHTHAPKREFASHGTDDKLTRLSLLSNTGVGASGDKDFTFVEGTVIRVKGVL